MTSKTIHFLPILSVRLRNNFQYRCCRSRENRRISWEQHTHFHVIRRLAGIEPALQLRITMQPFRILTLNLSSVYHHWIRKQAVSFNSFNFCKIKKAEFKISCVVLNLIDKDIKI